MNNRPVKCEIDAYFSLSEYVINQWSKGMEKKWSIYGYSAASVDTIIQGKSICYLWKRENKQIAKFVVFGAFLSNLWYYGVTCKNYDTNCLRCFSFSWIGVGVLFSEPPWSSRFCQLDPVDSGLSSLFLQVVIDCCEFWADGGIDCKLVWQSHLQLVSVIGNALAHRSAQVEIQSLTV